MSSTSPSIPPPPSGKRILVVGGGPAGSTTAFFLARAGFSVTVAELSTRAPYGQGIDITDEAVAVVKAMGLWEKIKAHTTGETGFALLDDAAGEIGRLGVDSLSENGEGKGNFSPTNEIEIMRGTLTKIIVDAAKAEGVEYRYGCTVTEIDQTSPDRVTARLSSSSDNDGPPEPFTAIIGADGVASRVRKLAFPTTEEYQNPFRQTDTYCAYFSMDSDPFTTPMPTHSRLQHGDKGRIIWLRPIDIPARKQSCYLIITSPHNTALEQISAPGSAAASESERKKFLENLYQDMRGIQPEAIRGMHASTDFYFTRIVQVVLPTWHTGRCGLVGDAAYCPSPLTGQGTTLALVGSYMMAGELARNPTDPAAAFATYKRKFEAHVKAEGTIPLGGRAPRIFAPQSQWGIWVLRTLFWGVSRVNLVRIWEALPSFSKKGDIEVDNDDGGKKFRLPKYSHFGL